MSNELFLVTGGSGFCGFEIVKTLLAHGEKVRVLDIEEMPTPLANVEFIRGDVRNIDDVKNACGGVSRIIHTVAKVPISKAGREFWRVNEGGTRHVLQAALELRIPKVVHISSSAVQCLDRAPIDENDPLNAIDPYAKSKLAAEEVCREFIQKGLAVDIIRPRTVLGDGRLGLFSMLFDWMAQDLNVYVIGSGSNIIQFIHSQDLAECCYLAARAPGSHVFNVGGAGYSPLREELEHLIRGAGSRSKVVSLPVSATILTLRILDFLRLSPLAPWHYLTYHKNFYVTNANAKKVLGWEPRYSNRQILEQAFKNFSSSIKKGDTKKFGVTHRKTLHQGVLRAMNRVLSRF